MNWKWNGSLLLGTMLVLALLSGCGGKTEPGPPAGDSQEVQEDRPAEGAAALGSLASFTAGTLDGETFTQEDLAGKDVTVFNFWALTCPPCIAEMPDIAAFEKALPDNVAVVTVCLDGYGSEDSVQEVLENAGFEGTTLITGEGDLLDLASQLMYTPTTVLADSGGALVGEAIIGGQADLSAVYLAAVNQALEAGGKDEISLGDA
ncbi:MAG: TlpA family protein disulfide reductase [Oscillibacter sp.]|jgi:thiol-disulfide isomerase/thioredoxin|uniref:TlpA family protein disulfide reductase n=1 Tax=uncultured Oscillibacter sp. TaxID=876091 RepID=UPI00217425D9|nr:TlpA disulfide reductase family protein [uncultured Oscillibacter sp.]MCI9643162.1 TlpA family protein disulfide reductase [Oscillibacter sp.]